MRTYYSDYVQHCMRFYARHPQPHFHTNAELKNWNACDFVMKGFTPSEKQIVLTVFRKNDTLSDNIYESALELNVNQDVIWELVSRAEKLIAKRRGLL